MVLHPGRDLFLGPTLSDIVGPIIVSGDHSKDIAIHRRDLFIKGDAGNGAAGVGANAGKGDEGVIIPREMPRKITADDFGRLVEISGTTVIPETLPSF